MRDHALFRMMVLEFSIICNLPLKRTPDSVGSLCLPFVLHHSEFEKNF